MAIGFTPKYVEDLPFDGLTSQQFLALAVDVARQSGWDVRHISEQGLIAVTDHRLMKWNAEVTITLDAGAELAHCRSESTGTEMVDLGRNRKTITAYKQALQEARASVDLELLTQKYEELKPELVPPEMDILLQPRPTAKAKAANFLTLFIPKGEYYITPILVDLNIAVFVLMVLSGVSAFLPDSQQLLHWGANFRPFTLNGQWWRLITNTFLHIGIFHLALNMYALLYVGLLLEPFLGKARFIAAYLLTGIMASLTSVYWHEFTVSAGASGAIFGMYGVFLALLTTNFIDKTARKPLLTSIALFVGYNLLVGTKGGIDNAAHIGGLISGLIFGYAYYISLKKPAALRLQYSIIGLLTAGVTLTVFITITRIPNDAVKYEADLKQFGIIEDRAMAVYHKYTGADHREEAIAAIRDSGIYYWKEDIRLMEEVKKLNTPEMVKQQAATLIEYCQLRIRSYEVACKYLEKGDSLYKDSMNFYKDQILSVMKEFSKGK